ELVVPPGKAPSHPGRGLLRPPTPPPFVGAPVSGANTGPPVSATAPRSPRDQGGGVAERPLDDHAAVGPDSCRRSAGALHPVTPRTSWCSSLPGTPLFAPGAGAPTAADASPFCRSTRLGCEYRPSPLTATQPGNTFATLA